MIGKVEYNLDPEHQGRIKVRIQGVNDQKIDDEYVIPTSMLPWALPKLNNSGCIFSVPKIGDIVRISGTPNIPLWEGNLYVSNDVVYEISGNGYTNSHILMYDTDFNNGDEKIRSEHIKVFFTEKKGFMIDYKTINGKSIINIKNDGSIIISNNSGDVIQLDSGNINISSNNTININASLVNLSDQATESIIKGEQLKKIFNEHTHICNTSSTTPPIQKITDNQLNKHIKV